MGYEHRIYIVEKSVFVSNETGKQFARVIAMFNFCKYPGMRNVFKNKTNCFIYADDEDTQILEDRYGDELTEAPLSDVIDFLENEIMMGADYRRIAPLLGLLKSFDESQWDNLVCLHYGY